MIDDIGDIAAFYSSDPEREHARLITPLLERSEFRFSMHT
jgi:hypothetical protein